MAFFACFTVDNIGQKETLVDGEPVQYFSPALLRNAYVMAYGLPVEPSEVYPMMKDEEYGPNDDYIAFEFYKDNLIEDDSKWVCTITVFEDGTAKTMYTNNGKTTCKDYPYEDWSALFQFTDTTIRKDMSITS